MSTILRVENADFTPYDIRLTADWSELPDAIREVSPRSHRLCIVTDCHVAELYLETVQTMLKRLPMQVDAFVLPAGEEHKTLAQIERLYAYLIEHDYDRHDMLLALGGGVIGDMTGFAAATYLRGIDFIQVPTTLLAQVDSSIGGKTGVDFACYKNMVGAFKQPRLVYMNLATLHTLPIRQLSSGMAEIIKHGCIKNATYFYELLERQTGIFSGDIDTLYDVVRKSLQIKKKVVESDPFEKGERVLLNYGHTFGHALEKESGFSLLHGEAVSLGCVAAGFIAHQRGLLTAEELTNMEQVFRVFRLPVRSTFDLLTVLAAVKHDKKMDGRTIRFILLDSIGNGIVDSTITDHEMHAALEYLQEAE